MAVENMKALNLERNRPSLAMPKEGVMLRRLMGCRNANGGYTIGIEGAGEVHLTPAQAAEFFVNGLRALGMEIAVDRRGLQG